MPLQNSQAPQDPNDAAANLALMTHLSTQLAAPQQPQEASQESQNAPQEAPQAPDLAPEVEKLQKQVDALEKAVKKDPKDDLAEIRKQVEEALAQEDDKEHGK